MKNPQFAAGSRRSLRDSFGQGRHKVLGVLTLFAALPALQAKNVAVVNNADSGPGSFRAAVAAANGDAAIEQIVFRPGLGVVALSSTVTYTGAQGLTIHGGKASIEGSAGAFDLLAANGGGDLALQGLSLRNSGGSGLAVDLPAAAAGVVSVSLAQVLIEGNGEYGVRIDDPGDSDAGIALDIQNSTISNNGFAVSDADGLFVGESGEGGIHVAIKGSELNGNGADGIEIDESGEGSIVFTAIGSAIEENGSQDAEDLEDGIDFDETGGGDLLVELKNVSILGNSQQGIDADESDEGVVDIRMLQCDVVDHPEEGLSIREDGDGDTIIDLAGSEFNGNGFPLDPEDDVQQAVDCEEADEGDLIVHIVNTDMTGNGDDG